MKLWAVSITLTLSGAQLGTFYLSVGYTFAKTAEDAGSKMLKYWCAEKNKEGFTWLHAEARAIEIPRHICEMALEHTE